MKKCVALSAVPGFSVAAISAGIKTGGRLDLGLIVSDQPVQTAAVFTSNQVTASPVRHSRRSLVKSSGVAQAILVNAGNANCCTGALGLLNAEECASRVAKVLGCSSSQVLLASTGIIGEQLPMPLMRDGIDRLIPLLSSNKTSDKQFAEAIRTLDTYAKEASTVVEIDGRPVTITGAAKGIGMCAPNMATVLIFLLTDAVISLDVMRKILTNVVSQTINRVSVDGDQSTNDSCFLMSSGLAGNPIIRSSRSESGIVFASGLTAVCDSLARMLASDGEGASKFIPVRVTRAKNQREADIISRAIAESPLVKTAVYGADPNWGRIMMAAGKCGCTVDQDRATVWVGGLMLFKEGKPVAFDPAEVSSVMKKKSVSIHLDLNLGKAESHMYTCDFTDRYISINADYHT